ncbi:hypothetical protein CBM2585_B20561 [Cupriavidus taiwanensis]|nr:hypothetical protein CBM2585_B20561 [Cupriavidus taiwanensis]
MPRRAAAGAVTIVPEPPRGAGAVPAGQRPTLAHGASLRVKPAVWDGPHGRRRGHRRVRVSPPIRGRSIRAIPEGRLQALENQGFPRWPREAPATSWGPSVTAM